MTVERIDSFQGDYRFLSNFYPAWVIVTGIQYPTSEHAYQASKTLNLEQRVLISQLPSPGQAKRAGQALDLRPDWESIKLDRMQDIVELKFLYHPDLMAKLMDTGDAVLVEGNTWGDTFWGQVDGVGENHLGRILMTIRSDFRGLGK